MDSSLSALKDHKINVEQTIKPNLIRLLERYNKADKVEQSKLNTDISNNLKNFKTMNDLIKTEITGLSNPDLEKTYKDLLSIYKQDLIKFTNEFEEKKKQALGMDNITIQEKNKKASEMTSLELMKAGDDILADDRKKIKNIEKEAKTQLNIANEIKADLKHQEEQLDNVDNDLKEIDFSLKRAGKQIATMFKMYATDKLILVLIVLIVLQLLQML